MIKTIITFIIVFGTLVVIHELGHFIAAKRSGILVREFAIGFGPKIFSHRSKGTTYTIRLLPVGGYVRMAGNGEDENDLALGMPISVVLNAENLVTQINTSKKIQLPNSIPLEVTDFDLTDRLFITGNVGGSEQEEKTYQVDHDATLIEEDGTEVQIAPRDVQMQSAKLSRRMITNFAGPFNNFVLSLVLFLFVGIAQGIPVSTNSLNAISEDTPAEAAGFKKNDEIIAIDGTKVTDGSSIMKKIQSSPDQQLTVTVKRGKENVDLTVTPKAQKSDGKTIGVIGVSFNSKYTTSSSLGQRIKFGWDLFVSNALGIFRVLGSLFTDFSLNKLGGPVMIFEMSSRAAQSGFFTVVAFMASLSVNLGIVNMMPIPGLDGGKLLLNLYEAVRRKPLSQEKEVYITMIGFVFVIGLFIMVTWNDISRFFLR